MLDLEVFDIITHFYDTHITEEVLDSLPTDTNLGFTTKKYVIREVLKNVYELFGNIFIGQNALDLGSFIGYVEALLNSCLGMNAYGVEGNLDYVHLSNDLFSAMRETRLLSNGICESFHGNIFPPSFHVSSATVQTYKHIRVPNRRINLPSDHKASLWCNPLSDVYEEMGMGLNDFSLVYAYPNRSKMDLSSLVSQRCSPGTIFVLMNTGGDNPHVPRNLKLIKTTGYCDFYEIGPQRLLLQ